ncbi:hypothetical protein [Variovorax sp. KK3]|uniref:hypothetical protein n=1 Tax=Variovorax sp. KK3 TaxID=1855728 RepID=UPI00117FD5DC|nr:hypothetical protein [Variovorax sp. KK3]
MGLKMIGRLRGPGVGALLFQLAIAAFVIAALWRGAGVPSFGAVALALGVVVLFTQAGSALLTVGKLDALRARLPAAFVAGFALVSLLTLGLVWAFELPALRGLAVAAAVLLPPIAILRSRRGPVAGGDLRDAGITAVLVLLVLVWAWEPTASALTLARTGVLPIWSDYFLHAVTIASFGGPFSIGGDMELAGASRGFYHYAPFVIPAAFQAVGDYTPLALSTAVLMPMGVLMAVIGGYALATELAGRRVGLLTMALVIAVPAWRAFLQSGWLDFDWMLFTSPGAGYAIGVSLLVCVAASRYVRTGDTRTLLVALALLASIVLIRAHMFLLLAPPIATLALLRYTGLRLRLLVFIAAVALLLFGAALAIADAPRNLFMQCCNPATYLDFSNKYTLFYGNPIGLGSLPFLPGIAAKSVIVVAAVLGLYIVAFPVAMFAARREEHSSDADRLLPLLVLVTFLALILLAPSARNGDFTEYKHRHFPLLYIVFTIYTIAFACRSVIAGCADPRTAQRWIEGSAVLLILWVALFSWRSNPAAPDVVSMPWGGDFHDRRVLPGLLEAASYLRSHAQPGDVMAMEASEAAGQSHQIVDTISLTGLPAYLSRSDLRMLMASCVQQTVQSRLKVLATVAAQPDWARARDAMRANDIRWYLSTVDHRPPWDPQLNSAAFAHGKMVIHDAGPLPAAPRRIAGC